MQRPRTGKTVWLAAGMMALAVSSGGVGMADGPGAGGAGSDKQDNAAASKEVTLASLVESLGSAKFQEREAATMALMRLPAERLSEVEDILAKETDAEVIVRLEKVAVHLMLQQRAPLNGSVALLGIMLTIEPWTDPVDASKIGAAVVVTGIQAGFPAAEVLQPGDRIVAVEGREFPQGFVFDDFRAIVSMKQAGDIMRLTVMRNGKKLELAVRVAGVELPAGEQMADYIAQRGRIAEEYLARLKTGLKEKAVVMKDDSPIVEEGVDGWSVEDVGTGIRR